MSQPDAAPSQSFHDPNASRASTPVGRRGPSSHETGESSATGSSRKISAQIDPTVDAPTPGRSSRSWSSTSRPDHDEETHMAGPAKDATSFRPSKVRSSGGFLLQNTPRSLVRGNGGHKQQSKPLHRTPQSDRLKSSPRASEKSGGSSAGRDPGQDHGMDGTSHAETPSPHVGSPPNLNVKKRQLRDINSSADQDSPPRPASQGLDVNPTEIVNMALNLSEARRMASRRSASNAAPPSLTPVPDSGTGGSLRQHLQQQRRTSRNISPRPDHGMSPRVTSAANTPMQASFNIDRDGSFNYHFSHSTMARAQKAKEQLELMAQYRRLLDFVPPLTPTARGHHGDAPAQAGNSMPNGHSGINQLGRSYNPLQYIRNRKVRARERKGIDGEAQGFGDVKKITDWIDHVAKWAATGRLNSPDEPTLPSFAEADLQAQKASPSSQATKQKRPRVDWIIDPADMVADVYWLEQDHHLELIEDRHWRRIFPKTAEPKRPSTGHGEKAGPDITVKPSRQEQEDVEDTALSRSRSTKIGKSETDQPHNSARDRARQKLQELRGVHRHDSSGHSPRETSRRTKSTRSDLSDSEDEQRSKSGPRRTYTSNSKDILEKQMLEMMAKEAEESGSKGPSEHTTPNFKSTPERQKVSVAAQEVSQDQSRKPSLTDTSEPDDKPTTVKSHTHPVPYFHRSGRPSLEIPLFGRKSSDLDASVPTSPDQRPGDEDPFIPTIGADLSHVPNRSGSPPRNPFRIVKSMFRERGSDPYSEDAEVDHDAAAGAKVALPASTEPSPPVDATSVDKRRSKSPPIRKALSRPSLDTERPSYSQRSEEASSKGFFRGARIDNVLRGGASKLGELIWRKEPEQSDVLQVPQSEGEGTLTEESDTEPARGRRRLQQTLSRTASNATRADQERLQQKGGRNFLDVMPSFQHTLHEKPGEKPTATEPGSMANLQSSRPPSRSSRFDLLKPPRIDVDHPSPSLSPSGRRPEEDEMDVPTEASRNASYSEGLREADRRLNSVISMTPSFNSDGHRSSLATNFDRRHWSTSNNRSPSPQRAPVSRREAARLRALVLSSGIMAKEISRRAQEPRPVFAKPSPSLGTDGSAGTHTGAGPNNSAAEDSFWPSVAQVALDPEAVRAKTVAQTELYQVAGQVLGESVRAAGEGWQRAADEFASDAAPGMQARIEEVRRHVAVDLSAMTRAAADEADETSRDLAHGQRLKIKHVVDVIEKMLRRRRRRFRWVRRGLWLGVEWVLVGFMWYVWFVVMIMRVFLGVGRGFLGAVRWLLFL